LSKNLIHIIAACQRNELAAQKELYSLFVDRLYYVIFRYTNNDFYTQNILQDVFLKVFKNIDSFNPNIASFNTWISTIAIRESINHCRKKAVQFQPIDEHHLGIANVDMILSKLQAEELLKLIASIPEKYRVIFNLYEIDGYKHKEIAKILRITESTSRSYLARAKRIIQEELRTFYFSKGIAK